MSSALEALRGIVLRVCGDHVVASQAAQGQVRLQVRQSHSDAFKRSLNGYVRAYNEEHGTQITVSFPKPFELRLREQQRKTR